MSALNPDLPGAALHSGIDAAAQVIPGEDPGQLEALAADYHRQFQPAGPLERFLVDSLIYADWQLRRLRRAEAQLGHDQLRQTRESIKVSTKQLPSATSSSAPAMIFTTCSAASTPPSAPTSVP